MEKNKTEKYLKYAFGEILLVMIGILLVLQVNNWNENRKERIAKQTLYRTLISSLEDANDIISSIDESIKAQEIFIVNSLDEIKNKYNTSQL